MKKEVEIAEKKITEVAETLQVEIPKARISGLLKFIALFTLIGGLSIIGSLFVDIVQPERVSGLSYLLQIAVSAVAITAAYSILKKNYLAFWLFALITILALLLNPVTAVVPGIAAIYLYFNRPLFKKTKLDILIEKIFEKNFGEKPN